MKYRKIEVFESTLRDGAQGEGISYSVEDKIKIVKLLDELGIDFIEAGNPGSNQKDIEFFKKVEKLELSHSKLVAFGSTRRKNIDVKEDNNLKALLGVKTEYVSIFGKAWDFHATEVIGVSLEENLIMIEESIKFLAENGKKVFFDAEHFFDGYKANPEYAMEVLKIAEKSGAISLVLCDTNGGCFPREISEIVKEVKKNFKVSIGIHAHNDTGMAVANTICAVEEGSNHVQGTIIGTGERCGNTNLSTVISNLELKKNYLCLNKKENFSKLTHIARTIAEISNISLESGMPYVGTSAFSHKAGMHIDGVLKYSKSFEHIDPSVVGNNRRFLTSEISGRNTVLKKINNFFPEIKKESPVVGKVVKALKELEYAGYQFEGAEASFELLLLKEMGKYKSMFEIEHFTTITNKDKLVSAMIKINIDGKSEITAAEGNGPVNALDFALRKGLENFYPTLKETHLSDYKVRVLNSSSATGAKVRVLIETKKEDCVWTTVGVSTDIIEASLTALKDSIEYSLLINKEEY